jgi:hypothetical protein
MHTLQSSVKLADHTPCSPLSLGLMVLRKAQGKSVHCGFDPEVDPPDWQEVPLPDPEEPVQVEPAAPATLSLGAEVKSAGGYKLSAAKGQKTTPSDSNLTYQAMPLEHQIHAEHNSNFRSLLFPRCPRHDCLLTGMLMPCSPERLTLGRKRRHIWR